jgi:hypothetical protein
METAVVVVIGRGVGEAELEYLKWQYFISDLIGLVKKAGGQIYTEAHGTGHCGGQIEDSYIVSFGQANLASIRHMLGRLAYEYDQECIALIIGTCELVSAWTS